MKSLIIALAVLLVADGAFAGKLNLLGRTAKVVNSTHESPRSLKLKIIDGLDFVEDNRNRGLLHRVFKNDTFEKVAFTRQSGYAEIRGVTGYYDNGLRNYYLRIELDGYSDDEIRLLARHLHDSGIVRFNTGSKSLEINLLKDLKNTNQLDKRLDDIGEKLADFFRRTDASKNMVNEVIATRKSVYGIEGAR